MEDKAQDQRPGPDPRWHEAWDRSQAPTPGGGLRCDGMCTTLLLTLRVSSPVCLMDLAENNITSWLFADPTIALIKIKWCDWLCVVVSWS